MHSHDYYRYDGIRFLSLLVLLLLYLLLSSQQFGDWQLEQVCGNRMVVDTVIQRQESTY